MHPGDHACSARAPAHPWARSQPRSPASRSDLEPEGELLRPATARTSTAASAMTVYLDNPESDRRAFRARLVPLRRRRQLRRQTACCGSPTVSKYVIIRAARSASIEVEKADLRGRFPGICEVVVSACRTSVGARRSPRSWSRSRGRRSTRRICSPRAAAPRLLQGAPGGDRHERAAAHVHVKIIELRARASRRTLREQLISRRSVERSDAANPLLVLMPPRVSRVYTAGE